MIQIIAILVIFIILLVIAKIVDVKFTNKKILEAISDDSFKQINSKFKNNKSICEEILMNINNTDVKVEVNENKESSDSFYNVFNNKIILCDNQKVNNSFARLLFISHECHHSRQDKKLLWLNFILANINIIYFFITSVLIFLNIIKSDMYLMFLSIMLIINIFSYLARYIIEADAAYMSINISRQYAKKYLFEQELDKVMEKFEDIISNGFSTFAFGLFLNNVPMIIIYMILIIIKFIQI